MWISPLAPAPMQLLRHAHTSGRRTARQSLRWFHHQSTLTRLGLMLLACVALTPLASALTSPATPTLDEATFYIRPLPDHMEVKRAYPLNQQAVGSDETPVEKRLRVVPHKHSNAASLYLDNHELIRLRETDLLPKPYEMALTVARKLYEATTREPLTSSAFRVEATDGDAAVIFIHNDPLLTVDSAQAKAASKKMSINNLSTQNLASTWARHLTEHFGVAPSTMQSSFTSPENASNNGFQQSGQASWYGPKFNGRRTASGERFDMSQMTAAHRTLPFGTLVRVTNTRTNQSAVVRINDRGPYAHGRIIDLSKAGAKAIGMLGSGVASVTIQALPAGTPITEAPPIQVATNTPVAFTPAAQPVVPIRPGSHTTVALNAIHDTPVEVRSIPEPTDSPSGTATTTNAITPPTAFTNDKAIKNQKANTQQPVKVACASPSALPMAKAHCVKPKTRAGTNVIPSIKAEPPASTAVPQRMGSNPQNN